MELVYLWVKEYKNIHNQGFNFSPRFRCEYDEEENELTIDENDDYIPDFFGENINVTAIVGKNGSGKSSVLEILDKLLNGSIISSKAFIVLKGKELGSAYKMDISIKSSIYLDKKNFDTFNIIESFCDGTIFYHTYSDKLSNILEDNEITLDDNSIHHYLARNFLDQLNFQISSFMYIPNRLQVKINFDTLFNKVVLDYNDNAKQVYKFNPQSTKLIDIGDSNLFSKYHKFLIIYYVENNGHDGYHTIDLSDRETLLEEYKNFPKYKEILTEEDIEKYFSDRTLSIDKMTILEQDIYLKDYCYFFERDFIDQKNRKYQDLSHGEKVIFGQLLNIFFIIKKNNDYDITHLFAFDEPETSLHPNWQRQYLNEINTLLKRMRKKYHFVFATHSPFLLSDLPKENIIFLDTYENGNCKVVDGLKEKKQTFGANIHTLLSDSFFMEDGLMGEFAKEKIDEVITLLNKKKLTKVELKKCEQIISIIGEPIIKNQLQRMLDNKRLKKVDEIDKIKREMRMMNQRLKELENDSLS